MTANDPTHERERELGVQQTPDGEWHEQTVVQVTTLSGDEKDSESSGHLKVLEPEGDDESAVALSIESETEDCMVRIDVGEALSLADKLELVADRVAFGAGDTP